MFEHFFFWLGSNPGFVFAHIPHKTRGVWYIFWGFFRIQHGDTDTVPMGLLKEKSMGLKTCWTTTSLKITPCHLKSRDPFKHKMLSSFTIIFSVDISLENERQQNTKMEEPDLFQLADFHQPLILQGLPKTCSFSKVYHFGDIFPHFGPSI